jgi:hypothetical protein
MEKMTNTIAFLKDTFELGPHATDPSTRMPFVEMLPNALGECEGVCKARGKAVFFHSEPSAHVMVRE